MFHCDNLSQAVVLQIYYTTDLIILDQCERQKPFADPIWNNLIAESYIRKMSFLITEIPPSWFSCRFIQQRPKDNILIILSLYIFFSKIAVP